MVYCHIMRWTKESYLKHYCDPLYTQGSSIGASVSMVVSSVLILVHVPPGTMFVSGASSLDSWNLVFAFPKLYWWWVG